jgi:murein DD-endopeptidase MepM/ murein hydrolase activator NlpD
MGFIFEKGSLCRWDTRNARKSIFAAIVLVVMAIVAYAILDESGRTIAGSSLPSPSPPHVQSVQQRERNNSGDEPRKIELAVKRGDSIFTILKACGIDGGGIHTLSEAVSHLYDLADIIPGHAIKVWIKGESPAILARLIYDIDSLKYLEVVPEGESFKAMMRTRSNAVSYERVQGKITSSLYESAVGAGLKPEIVMDLTEIFGWDINFFTDIQAGDTYTVLCERYTIEGKPGGCKRVLAARFVLQDQEHTAVYHDDGNGHQGYYDEHGNPIRKLFLKAPLNFRRISSRFSYNRNHPIFHVVRPHLGVDYAAPLGTPVVALGAGRVTGHHAG